jgi:hypothetical protein
MRRSFITLTLVFALFLLHIESYSQCNQKVVYECATNNGNAVYLKDFNAKLQKAKKNEPSSEAKFSVVLNKGTHYRFNLCDPVGFEGRSVLKLFSANKMLASTFDEKSGKEYKHFDFICKKTMTYYVYISYKDPEKAKKGCAVGILSFVNKN